MTDRPEILERYRLPLTRGHLKQARAFTPILKAVPKNPLVWLGAAAVGIAGFMAWKQRDKIAAAAQPLLEEAKARSSAMIETARTKGGEFVADAKTKGGELIEEAKAKGEAAVEAVRMRRTAAPEIAPPDLH